MLFVAIALQLLSIIYHQITTNLDLFPLNNVRHFTPKERRRESMSSGLIMAVPLLFLLAAVIVHSRALVMVSAAASFFLFIGASLTWWPPYLFGWAFKFAAMGEDWNELHARTFGKTLIILPAFRGRPRPNLEHNILHLMMLAAAITTALSAGRAFAG
jgi:hypothetical protein